MSIIFYIKLTNDSWNDDPYSTALALHTRANVKPNLIIMSSDIAFSNPNPTMGEIPLCKLYLSPGKRYLIAGSCISIKK
jgi:hypothetical protein